MGDIAIVGPAFFKVLSKLAAEICEFGKSRAATELRYLRNESSIKKVGRSLRKIEKVKTFWSDNKEIPLSSFYYPSRIVLDRSAPATVNSLADLPPGYCYVIEGTVGQGKSIFMRFLAMKELNRGVDARIPIFAELRFLQAEESFEQFLYHAFEIAGLQVSKALFDVYAESGRIVLFLDAFDEIDPALIKRTIRDLDRLTGRYPNLQIVVSSRPDTSVQRAAGFRVAVLAPLGNRDHEPFIGRITRSEKQTAAIIKAVRKSSSSVGDLLTTPLLLTLLISQ